MAIKKPQKLSDRYNLPNLKKKGDGVMINFRILSDETAFRVYCSKYAKSNGFLVSVSKKHDSFLVTRIN